MTQKELDQKRDELDEKYYGNNPRVPEYLKMPITQEDAIMYKKLDIYDMMISNLTYGSDYFQMTKESWYVANRGSRGYDWDQLRKLGVRKPKTVIKQMWEEMKRDFAEKATVYRGTYTDTEGLTYNSVGWSD